MLDTAIEYLKGVGPQRGEALKRELGIYTFGDLLLHFPFRYIDRTRFQYIREVRQEGETYQLKGVLRRLDTIGEGRSKRLVGLLRDETGALELVWFQGLSWIERSLTIGKSYIVYGRASLFNGRFNIAHPEIEEFTAESGQTPRTFEPVYPSSDKLAQKGLDARGLRRLMRSLLDLLTPADLPENLPDSLLSAYRLMPRWEAFQKIHFPENQRELEAARRRLKFEELFFLQLRLLQIQRRRKDSYQGFVFERVGEYFHRFYREKLPFELTNAQKRVVREIRADLGSGIQMNRLIQGDVGSGKTVVALLAMLIAIDNGFQACLMAPTEILAQQHYNTIKGLLGDLGVQVGFLSGVVKGKARRALLEALTRGAMHILIGTHALIEESVKFHRLGLAVIDEQHRFGVEQRAALWAKGAGRPPHILVMTATPIPRTLAMTLYGDLDVSIIDELPPGRKPVKTLHFTEQHRLRVQGFMREQIAQGRQVYVVYPMIEETEKSDLLNLMSGYEALSRDFPPPQYQISIVHGKMKPADKEFEMQRFARGETHIMVATTVIEVGVNVPNATVMIIENAERFGLSQLHQLRGRVGRGSDQSYCILMTSHKLSADARERLQTLVRTNNGFEIAEADLRLRGPGNIEGTQQSGMIRFLIADLAQDGPILVAAREIAQRILEADPELKAPEHRRLCEHLAATSKEARLWSRIS
ncbi:MAG: ATP-dependent DNA helicase RecG [Saprospiraceae bacterium]|nr:ATP-dependent DNA helicase RecG [Saprospiraceae bacterium]MDW8483514.1 ATP-dependent DNA helicase RecG [Saprospiraceae bacterium]